MYILFNNIVFTTLLSLFKSTRAGTNLSTSNLSVLLFELLKLLGTLFNLTISNLSTLGFKLAKSSFLANFDVSRPVSFFKNLIQLLFFLLKISVLENIRSFIPCLFYQSKS